MSKCGNCSGNIRTNASTIQCDACQSSIHTHCVGGGLTEQDITVTRSKSKAFKLVCNSCERNMSFFKDLKMLITDLRAEFTSSIESLKYELEEQINSAKSIINQQPPMSQSFEDVVQEVLERQKRSSNIIVFNVPEHAESIPRSEGLDKDKRFVSEVLNSVDHEYDYANFHCQRLGKFNASRITPIKVFLNSEQDVSNIIRKAKNLITTEQYKNIRLSYDRTPKQLDFYKQLKQEMNDRIRQGETNLKIRYYNGSPRIVRLN